MTPNNPTTPAVKTAEKRKTLSQFCNETMDAGNIISNRMYCLIRDAAEKYKDQEVSIATGEKWVSVEDGLPEDGINVIVYTSREFDDDPKVIVAWVSRGFWYSIFAHEDEDIFVTDWQPLPQPPTKVKGETEP